MARAETSFAESATTNPCPKCGKPLTDAAGLGWCPACGYCRSLEETPTRAELEREAPPSPATDELGKPVGPSKEFVIPVWAMLLVLGIAALAGGSYFAGKKLDPNSFGRALWTSVQIALGILVLFIGQFIALVRVAPSDPTLSFKDAILPFRLYGHVFQRLPRLSFSVCTLGWGITLIAAALFFIGGLNHWFSYIQSNKNRNQATSRSS